MYKNLVEAKRENDILKELIKDEKNEKERRKYNSNINTINTYNSVKLQISLGAGLEYYKEAFFPERVQENTQENTQEENEQESTQVIELRQQLADKARQCEEQANRNAQLEEALNEEKTKNAALTTQVSDQANRIAELEEALSRERTQNASKPNKNRIQNFLNVLKSTGIGKKIFKDTIKELPTGEEPETEERDNNI